MENKSRLIPFFFIFSLHCWSVWPHPQCLDFKPPFTSHRPQPFCPQYIDFGCCTNAEDATLSFNYMHISRELVSRNLWRCSVYIRDLLCQPCSPYAAHIYDAEGSGPGRLFPGLCEGYCRMLYRECSEALFVLAVAVSGEPELIHSIHSEDTFCSQVNLTDTDYCYPELLTNPSLNERIHFTTVNSEGCLCVEDFADNLRNPLFMKYINDNSGRILVGEQCGVIWVYYDDGTRLSEPFLNISDIVNVGRQRGDERGMLQLALHTHFRQNSRFFLYYYTKIGGHKIRVSEFTLLPWDTNKADVLSERILLEVEQPYQNHNGGEMFFGDDGYLYIITGDGGAAGDPDNNSQNLTVLLGKVLRIDVDSQPLNSAYDGATRPYSIPPDNPFVGQLNVQPEIYAYGVRNMWRCGTDRGDRETGYGRGRVICGDVGQSAFEEINILKKGANYGWRSREGFACYDDDMCDNIGPEELPIFAYPHRVGKSITGGHIYRGCDNPNLNGHYFYGDYTNGKLFRLVENPISGQWENRQVDMCGPEYCKNGLHSEYPQYILSFGEDSAGEVFILASRSSKSGVANGGIYKIVDPRRRHNPMECHNRRRNQYTVHAQRVSPLKVNTTVKYPSTESKETKASVTASSGSTIITSHGVFTFIFASLGLYHGFLKW